MKDILLGSIINFSSPDYYYGAAKIAHKNKENCFMICTGSPQSSLRVPLESTKIEESKKFMKENGIDVKNNVVHAAYLINLASSDTSIGHDGLTKRQWGIKFLKDELRRTIAMGINKIVIHPGSNENTSLGIKNIAESINEINPSITICLETMAGKGNEIGKNLEQIAEIISLVKNKNTIGVCIDTCHLNDAGYDMSNFDKFLNEFDKVIGLKYLKVIHLNDSLNKIGDHKDRHANIGYGTIGFNNIVNIVYNPRVKNIPKFLETPPNKDLSGYGIEIKMIRDKKFTIWIK